MIKNLRISVLIYNMRHTEFFRPLKSFSSICRIRQSLGKQISCIHRPLISAACSCIEVQQSSFAIACQIIFILNSATGVNSSCFIRCNSQSFLFPVIEILTLYMTPLHISPHTSIWIPLIIEMIKSICINHTIRVIMPSCCRCSMQFRTIRIYIIIRFPVTENSFQKFLVCTFYLQIFS